MGTLHSIMEPGGHSGDLTVFCTSRHLWNNRILSGREIEIEKQIFHETFRFRCQLEKSVDPPMDRLLTSAVFLPALLWYSLEAVAPTLEARIRSDSGTAELDRPITATSQCFPPGKIYHKHRRSMKYYIELPLPQGSPRLNLRLCSERVRVLSRLCDYFVCSVPAWNHGK